MLELVKAQLPAIVVQLADAIEAFAGREITMAEAPQRTNAACSVGADYARIEVPTLTAVRSEEILHELLSAIGPRGSLR
jgi:hypothetical protein